ncbi:hypothetical protein [Thiomonas sp.]
MPYASNLSQADLVALGRQDPAGPETGKLTVEEVEHLLRRVLARQDGNADRAWVRIFPPAVAPVRDAANPGRVYLALRSQEPAQQNAAESRQVAATLAAVTDALGLLLSMDRQTFRQSLPLAWKNDRRVRQGMEDWQNLLRGLEALDQAAERWSRNAQLKPLRNALFTVRRLDGAYRAWRQATLSAPRPASPTGMARTWATLANLRLLANQAVNGS